MKHVDDINPTLVRESLAAVGVPTTNEQASRLLLHLAIVLNANERMNLTRITSPIEALRLHIVDSLAFIPRTAPIEGKVLDLGSGAGYPGVPLSILGYDVTLCESVRKKALFLAGAVQELGLDTVVLASRAEELSDQRASFSLVIVRAVSSLAALVELASPLLEANGRLVSLKGRLETVEREQAEAAATVCGMTGGRYVEYRLPGGETRTLCEYVKSGPPKGLALPRRPGMAQRHPLGESLA